MGEAAVVILLITLASGRQLNYPLADQLSSSRPVIAALALAVVAVLAAAHFGTASLAARAGADVQRTVQRSVIGAYLDAPWPAQAASRTGELQDLVTVKVILLAYGAQETAQGLAALVNVGVVVAAAIVVSPYSAAALLTAFAVTLLISRSLAEQRRRAHRDAMVSSSSLALEVTETAAAARDLRVFGATATAQQELAVRIDEGADRSRAARLAISVTAPLTRDAAVALLVLGVAIVATQTGTGLATLGATVALMLRGLSHAQSLTSLGARLQEREDILGRIEGALAAWRPGRVRGGRPCSRIDELEIRDVTYTHRGGERPALDGVSLTLVRGELVGIVGRTGAGKSTFAATLLGLIEPDRGAVLADGVDLADLDPDEWHARTAWVGQEPRLLTATVRENIRFLRPGVSDDAILAAAEAAGLRAELERWSGGLDHPVGPSGGRLSGGERQRIALARALAGGPDLLVLDEPTSALDAHVEAAVRDALEQVRRHLIVVVIAHRLSTVRNCDRIAVMDSGQIRALATPAELERSNAYFQQVLALSTA